MDPNHKRYILDHARQQSPKEIALHLGIKERKIKRFLEKVRAENRASRSQPDRKTDWFFLLLIAAIGLLVYSNNYDAGFQIDDIPYLANPSPLHHLSDLGGIWRAGPDRFLTNVTLALNYHFGGKHVFGYHVVNNLIHILCAVLIYHFVLLIFKTPKFSKHSFAGNPHFIAVVSSLLFLCHPLQIQAVTYIIQRATSLATCFYLASCCLYLQARLDRNQKLMWLAFLVTAAAMFTKLIAFTLPLAIVLCEYFLFDLEESENRMPRWTAFLSTLVIVPLLRLYIIKTGAAAQFAETTDISSMDYLLTQFSVIRTYIFKIVWPMNQTVYYGFPMSKGFFDPPTFLSFLFLLAILLSGIVMRKKSPLISFGVLWFFLTLSVESSFLPIKHVIFEHRVYLPMAGVSIALASILSGLVQNHKAKIAAAAFIVIGLSLLTHERNKVWKTSESLWDDASKKYRQGDPRFKMTHDDDGTHTIVQAEDRPFGEWDKNAQ